MPRQNHRNVPRYEDSGHGRCDSAKAGGACRQREEYLGRDKSPVRGEHVSIVWRKRESQYIGIA